MTASAGTLDFTATAQAALASAKQLLVSWLPGGKFVGKEYVVLNPKRDDHDPDSFKINFLDGHWSDFATGDRGGDLTSLFAFLHDLSQLDAAKQLQGILGSAPLEPMPRVAIVQAARPARKQPRDNGFIEVVPIPSDIPVPPLPEFCFEDGNAFPVSAKYPYNSAEGKLLFWILRADKPAIDGRKPGKIIRPLRLVEDRDGKLLWDWKRISPPYPVYRLPDVLSVPAAFVVLVEGEKDCDSLRHFLRETHNPQYVCCTWMGGAKNYAKTDWSPLFDRKIIFWPDNDADGKRAMLSIYKSIKDRTQFQSRGV
jgi:putative DNA primase/helicase